MMTDALSIERYDTGRSTAPGPALFTARRPPPRTGTGVGSGRSIGIALVVLIHIGFLYALYVSLGTQSLHLAPQPIQVSTIADQKQAETPPPPPPPPDFKPPPPFVPPPEISVSSPGPATTAITAVTTTRPVEAAPPPPPPAAPVKRVLPDLDLRRSSDPVYPAESRRHGEEGLVVLLVMVEADGQPAEVRLEKSSGHDRLDQAAIDGAKHTLHYIPGTEDGKPARMWMRYRYDFQLH